MSRPARCGPPGLAGLLALALAVASAAAGSAGRVGGAALVRPTPPGGATVVGVVGEPVQLDAHGWAAGLQVERVLAGEVEPAAVLRIGWEELVRDRPARLAEGERVLVALEPLPAKSLWLQRFPSGDAFAIADAGSALLRAPDATSLSLLERYLALPSEEGETPRATAALSALVARATPALATGALARLDEIPGLAQRLEGASARVLAGALADSARPATLRRALLELVGRRRLEALRGEVVALTRAGSGLESEAWAARIALDGGLEPEQVALLLEQSDPALRSLAVRHARGTPAERQVRQRIRSDADPAVRAEAVEAWLSWRGEAALGDVEPALFDPDPRVRGRAALAVGGLGSAAVPRLRELVEGYPADQVLGPIAALRFAGREGMAALREIAASDPDEKKRQLARIGLGATRPH